MIPQQSVDALRGYSDVSVDAFGIACEIFIPNNFEVVQANDVYATPADYTYTHYTSLIFVVWSPTTKQLKLLGLYNEDELPIVAYLKNTAVNDNNEIVEVDVSIRSYVTIQHQFIPGKYGNFTSFEIVDKLIPHAHDATIINAYRLSPRRVQ